MSAERLSEQESRVCLHGSLRRVCETCDLVDRLELAEALIVSLRGAMAVQDEREARAGEACGVLREMHGCDWPDAVAERVIVLRDALLSVEWDEDGICLWCGACDEHESGCLRQRALAPLALDMDKKGGAA